MVIMIFTIIISISALTRGDTFPTGNARIISIRPADSSPLVLFETSKILIIATRIPVNSNISCVNNTPTETCSN